MNQSIIWIFCKDISSVPFNIVLIKHVPTIRKSDVGWSACIFIPIPVAILDQLELAGDDASEQGTDYAPLYTPLRYSTGKQVNVVNISIE